MSSDPFGSNPYLPPKPLADPIYQPAPMLDAPVGPWQMNYFGGIDMIHRRPDWIVNLLLMFVCAIIPVVGGIVLSGYCYEVVEILHRTNGGFYPKFDFNRFVEYLLRGVGPFLIALIFGTLLAVLILAGYFLIVVSALAASGAGQGNEAAVGIGVGLAFTVFILGTFVGSIAISFLQLPLGLRGGLSSDIGQSFNFGWAMDFVKKTWLEMLLCFLFLYAVGFVMGLLAAVTCYLGLIPGIGYVNLVFSWLLFQLYRVYLSRGGEPVPFKPAPLPLPVM